MAKVFSIPKKVTGLVASTEYLNSKILQIKITPKQKFVFYPGQFISLKVGENTFRSYSIASSEKENYISLIVAVGHKGVGANYLKNLEVGDEVNFIGPAGRFVLPKVSLNNLVFIATGTGLAPIISMLNTLCENKCSSKVTLYFGIRNKTEEFYFEKIKGYKAMLKNFSYLTCYSREHIEVTETSKRGRVTDFLEDCVEDKQNTQIFICGNPSMVNDVNNILNKAQVPKNNVFYEKFTLAK